MALTILPPAKGTVPRFGSDPAIQVTTAGPGGTVITLLGEADVSSRQAMSDVLSSVIASGNGDVAIDLAQTTFLDTAIIRTFFDAQQVLVGRGNSLTFRSPSRMAVRVLEMFGLTHLIEHATEVDRPTS